jgi:hypothetical protein
MAHFAMLAVNQRIVKGATWPEATQTCGFIRMAASSPTLLGIFLHEFFPPCFFDIVL